MSAGLTPLTRVERAGGSALSAVVVCSNTTLTALADLSRTVNSGKNYSFVLILRVADSNMEGLSLDFNGGSAIVSSFWASAIGWALEVSLARHSSALATVMSYESLDGGDGLVRVEGFFTASSTGTFIPRIAQASHVSGSLTVNQGSSLSLLEVL